MDVNITKILSRWNTQYGDISFILSLLLFQLLFIFQGLDFADQGAYATMYQQIFNDPESIQCMLCYWLSAVIGGLWLKIFPSIGLLGIRIAGVMVTTLTLAMVYYTLKRYLNIRNLRIGLIIALIIHTYYLPIDLYYNNISILLWISASFLIFNGIKKDKTILLFMSGVLTGLNIFARLSSILGVIILFSVLYYGWITHNSFRKQITQMAKFIGGFLSAILITLIVMNLMGHLGVFLKNIKITFSIAQSPEDPHNMLVTLKRFILQPILAFSYAGFFLIIAFLFAIISQILHKIKVFTFDVSILISVTTIVMVLLSLTGYFTGNIMGLFVIGITLLANIYVLLKAKASPEIRLLSLLGILLLLLFPAGSASGLIITGRNVLLISLPICIEVLRELSDLNLSINRTVTPKGKFTLESDRLRIIPGLFISVTLITGLVFAFSTTFLESSSRMSLVYSLDHEKLKGIYTSKERSVAVQELLDISPDYVNAGDYVLAYGEMCMYYYLTETRPYLKNPWPAAYTSEMLKNEIRNALNEKADLPALILQKVDLTDPKWPENTSEPYSTLTTDPRHHNYKLIEDFINRHNYKINWENSAFAILTSNSNFTK